MFLKTLKLFYEIPHLQAQFWGLIILPVGLGGSLLLALVEKNSGGGCWRRPGELLGLAGPAA